MPHTYWLTKSRYILGLQCPKALYLDAYRRDLARVPERVLERFRQGRDFERSVKESFGQAVDVSALPGMRPYLAPAATARLLADPQTHVLFEAGFLHGGVLVLADVVERAADGSLRIYEVKNASRPTETHRHDIAVQHCIISQCGHRIQSFSLVHRSADGGATRVDMLAQARADRPAVQSNIARFKEVLGGVEPSVAPGPQCTNPYECAFVRYCHGHLTAQTELSL